MKTIAIKTDEITGEVTVKFLESGKCIHTHKAATLQIAKNYIKKYKQTGEFPEAKISRPKIMPTVEIQQSVLRPVNYEYFHKRCQKPVYVADRESIFYKGMKCIVLILKDAAGKVYRIYEHLVKRYLSEVQPKPVAVC